jgi:predicted small lipoprotein YifL
MKTRASALLALALLFTLAGPTLARNGPSPRFPTIDLPPGYQIEKVVDGLTYATALTWDDQGRLYVAEAGGGILGGTLAGPHPACRFWEGDRSRQSDQ